MTPARTRPSRRRAAAAAAAAAAARRVLDVEHALEHPVVEPDLAQLVPVQDRPRTLPALLQKVQQRLVGLLGRQPVDAVQHAGRAVVAETALTRAHPEPQPPADVVEVGRARALDRLLQMRASDQLALADHLLIDQRRLLAGQSLAEQVVDAGLRAWQRLGLGRARAHLAEVLADCVDGLLGHHPVGRQLAAGDRHEAADPVALLVVEQRMGAGHVAGVGVRFLGVLEQRPDAGPNAQRPRLAKAGDELLAVVEHPIDLVLGDGVVVGVVGVLIGRPDHRDGPDGDENVAVGRQLAAVDNRVHEPMVHRDHDSAARQHPDALDPGHVRDPARPGATGVDGHLGLDVQLVARADVAHARARNPIAGPVDVNRLVIGEDPRAPLLGAVGHRPHRLPHVDVGVGDAERA